MRSPSPVLKEMLQFPPPVALGLRPWLVKTLCKEEGDHHQPNNLSQYATSAARNYIAGPNLVSESLEPLCQCHCACDDLRTSPKDCEDGIESRLPALPCEAMAAVETAAIATAAGGIGPVTSPCPAPLAETCSEHLRTEGPKRCRGLHDAQRSLPPTITTASLHVTPTTTSDSSACSSTRMASRDAEALAKNR